MRLIREDTAGMRVALVMGLLCSIPAPMWAQQTTPAEETAAPRTPEDTAPLDNEMPTDEEPSPETETADENGAETLEDTGEVEGQTGAETDGAPAGTPTEPEATAIPPAQAAPAETTAQTGQVPPTGADDAARSGEAPPYREPEGGLVEVRRMYRHLFLVSYDMAVPVGDTWDYIDAFSPRGMTFEYRFHINPHMGFGALVGWNNFDIKETGTFDYDNVTITGTRIRAMDVMHISLVYRYSILPLDANVVPYVGLDLGTYRIWRMADFGWWSASDGSWHFGFAPGIGAIFNLRPVTLILGAKFHMAVKTSDAPHQTFFAFNIGLGFPNY